jgi:pimeloyl-ACP methyl ester carboxylesterase
LSFGRQRARRLAASIVALLALSGCSGPGNDEPTRAATPTGGGTVEGRVDVGGYELLYACRGRGSPTVLLEAGYDSPGTQAFAHLLAPIAETTRVCTYDRAGTGRSDPRPDAQGLTSADQAEELRALLDGADIDPPYVVVAHSYGGFVARLFAAKYRDDTEGLVLIESSHEDEIEPYRRYYGDDPAGDWVDGGDLLDIDATGTALRERARDYGDLPLISIRAERYEDVLSEHLWKRTQAELASYADNGMHLMAIDSGHFVQDETPSVVLDAVRAVVEAARTEEPLPPCGEIFDRDEAACSPAA